MFLVRKVIIKKGLSILVQKIKIEFYVFQTNKISKIMLIIYIYADEQVAFLCFKLNFFEEGFITIEANMFIIDLFPMEV